MKIQVRRGSLTDGDESLLVNASNTQARLGSGVSHAIRMACGDGYQDAIVEKMHDRFNGPMAPADVFITDAGAHPRAQWVAHVAVMDYRQGAAEPFPDADRIRLACENLWREIESVDAASYEVTVAMVALGGGTGGLGVTLPSSIVCETLRAHLENTPSSKMAGMTFYGWTAKEFADMVDTVQRYWPDATAVDVDLG